MVVSLITLCLNEMEWLPKLYEQHKDWPGLDRWIFVEAADSVYKEANPTLVSDKGLSVDGTTEYLRELEEKDKRVYYLPYGLARTGERKEEGKLGPRQVALTMASLRSDWIILLDADEFYIRQHQFDVLRLMNDNPGYDGYVFHRREVWHPPSIDHLPLFSYEVAGGFWGIPCCHWWRHIPGMRYESSHTTPDGPDGSPLRNLLWLNNDQTLPTMIHLGFASSKKMREAKNRYYEARGEARDYQRRWYTKSRARFSSWTPADSLPRGATVIPWTGPIPECFT